MSIQDQINRITNEIGTQSDLIEQIKSALYGKAVGEKQEQEKEVVFEKDGEYEVKPEDGYTLSKAKISVKTIPENVLFGFTDYDDSGVPRTLIYNCRESYTQKNLMCTNTAYTGFLSSMIQKVILPNHVTTISQGTFMGMSGVQLLSNWDYIVRFENLCFAKNNNNTFDTGKGIQHTYFPPNLEYIGDSAFFRGGIKLASELPETLVYIGASAFCYGGNSNMRFTKLPPNLTYIGNDAFRGYFIFEKIIVPATVDYIGTGAFSGDYHKTSLKEIVFKGIPSTIGNTAFSNNTSLVDIYVPWAEGAVANAPWGATNATIHYNTQYDADGNPIIEEV